MSQTQNSRLRGVSRRFLLEVSLLLIIPGLAFTDTVGIRSHPSVGFVWDRCARVHSWISLIQPGRTA